MQIPAIIKEHPLAVTAVVGGGAVVLFLLMSGGSASAAPATGSGGQSSLLQSALAFQGQQAQLNQQTQLAGIQSASALALQNAQNSGALSLQQLQSGTAIQQIDANAVNQSQAIQAGITANNNATGVQEQQLTTQLQSTQSTNATTLGLANISAAENQHIADVNAGEQLGIAGINAASQNTVAGLNAGVQNNLINEQGNVNIAQIKAMETMNTNNNVFGVLGRVAPYAASAAFG